jgi:hypothetical protein
METSSPFAAGSMPDVAELVSSGGSSLTPTGTLTSPWAMIRIHSIVFRNCRTFPGQLAVCRTAMASAPIERDGRPELRAC